MEVNSSPMEFQWTSIDFKWSSNGVPLEVNWSPMEFPCMSISLQWSSNGSQLVSNGVPMEFQWMSIELQWNSNGHQLISNGVPMEFQWMSIEFQWSSSGCQFNSNGVPMDVNWCGSLGPPGPPEPPIWGWLVLDCWLEVSWVVEEVSWTSVIVAIRIGFLGFGLGWGIGDGFDIQYKENVQYPVGEYIELAALVQWMIWVLVQERLSDEVESVVLYKTLRTYNLKSVQPELNSEYTVMD